MYELNRDIKKLKENLSKFMCSGFSYQEQELILRVFKSVIKIIKNKDDLLTAKEIIKKVGWLENWCGKDENNKI